MTMNILIAVDSFKGNLRSLEAADTIEKGIRRVYPDAAVRKIPMADGGEGTMRTLVDYFHGETVRLPVMGPNGAEVQASYGMIQGTTAVIEMAEASGLTLIDPSDRNPMKATTYGTGQLIADALSRGCRKIILGIGGSATNDGGQGMAAVLGVRFLDESGNDVGLGGEALSRICDIDLSGLDSRLKTVEFVAACDVDNPLCGQNGASSVFGPQKGATPAMVRVLDNGLARYAAIIRDKIGRDVANIPGSGAAGGLGAGLLAFCGANLRRGIDLVMDAVELDAAISVSDVVITGEGRIDAQTSHGKVPAGVAERAKRYGKPVFAIAGYVAEDAAVSSCGIDAAVSSITAPMSNEEAISQSVPLIQNAVERLFRILKAAGMK